MKALGAAERGSLRKLGLSFLEPAGLGENEARIGLHDAQSQRPDSRLTLKGVQGSSAVAFGFRKPTYSRFKDALPAQIPGEFQMARAVSFAMNG